MTTVEQIANPIAGFFMETEVVNDEDENSDEEGDDDMQFLGYNELEDVRKGKSRVSSKKPKQLIGQVINIETRKSVNFRGNIHLPGPWWRVVALRTKKAKDKRHYPSDMHALTYRLRDDDRCLGENLVHLLLTKIGTDLNVNKDKKPDGQGDNDQSVMQTEEEEPKMDKKPVYFRGKEMFYTYLREHSQYNDLEILNLEERVTEFYNSFIEMPEDESTVGDEDEDPVGYETHGRHGFGTSSFNKTCVSKKKDGYELARDFKDLVLGSFDFRCIKLAQAYPLLVRYLPQLCPYQFFSLVMLPDHKHKNLLSAIEDNPGHLAFKQIVSKEYDVVGIETSHQALERCGLLAEVPQLERDAILIYEYLKRKTKEEGHTGVKYDAIMDYYGSELGLVEEAHQFLEKHKITKTRMESGYRMVYLMWLWNCEKSIAKGISSLFSLQEAQPWKLDVDWDSEQFTTIKKDNDQWRAAQLMASQPVVAISGKGGCGKTYVVTQVITAARAASPPSAEQDREKPCDSDANESDMLDDSDLMEYREPEQLKQPRSVKLLLTAPTGKAANLLGKRADQPSYTLHQVIFSHGLEHEWKHKDVNTLVVDECSLVAVSTFSHLIQLLIKHAQLRRIVLLGDVRQLPSIEPGNFLDDTFKSLERMGCGIELRNNHRAESQIIVDNATKISKKIYPEFVVDKFTLLKVPEGNPFETGDDTVSDDTEIEVRKVLNQPELQDDTNSQFISFTRKICERINEACCRKYSEHTTRTPRNRLDFRVKDKICCTKNGYVPLYEYDHGVMRKITGSSEPGKSKSNKTADASLNDTNAGLQQEEDDWLGEADNGGQSGGDGKKKQQEKKKRLCNGEIFFIQDVKIIQDRDKQREYFYLTERDPDEPDAGFWVDRYDLKKQCKIKHAWARTIHTFQGSETDHIVYIVGKRNRHQNWQHVYTAITRGRKSVFIIGQESVLRQVIKTKETKRNTSLRKQLTELLQKNPDFISSQSVLKQSMFCMSPVPPVARGTRNPHLDMTQGVTGLLAELAKEHDGIEAEDHMTDHVTEAKMAASDKVDSAADRIGRMDIETKSDIGFLGNSKIGFNQAIDVSSVGNENEGSSKKTKLKKKTEYRYQELDSTNRSPVHFLMKKNSANVNSPFSTGNSASIDNNDSFEISDCESPASQTGPRSNESIWSEADESQYASFLDATMHALNTGVMKVDKDSENLVNQSNHHLQNQGINLTNSSISSLESQRFTRLKPLFKSSASGFELKNLGQKFPDQSIGQKSVNDADLDSANSQWSNLPDEQYLTLNLEDIENMEKDFDAKNNRKKSLVENKAVDLGDSDDDFEDIRPYRRSKHSLANVPKKNGILNVNDLKDLDESLTYSTEYRNSVPLLKTPEKQVKVKDAPPLPSVPDTPPDQYSRKRRSVETHEDMITSPSKQRKDAKDLSLTPLKSSLAKLHFK